uniref:Chondroitin proteoglycan 4 domain-containing protein n=1 Tax=Parascaris univalens TaxID=6257 RepID=A0A914ZLB6_PARUN
MQANDVQVLPLPWVHISVLFVTVIGDEIKHLQFDTGALFADGHLNIDEKPEWTCVDLVSAQIEAKMRANQIDFRNHFLASLSQPDKLAVTCRQTVLLKADSDDFNLVSREIPFHLKKWKKISLYIYILSNSIMFRDSSKFYRETLNELNKCSENERLAPSALLIALQIVCVSRHQVLTRISECALAMEDSVAEKCQQFCLTKGDSRQLAYPINSCAFAECTAKCINLQLKECDDSKEVSNLYNEIAGTQMLMGIEAAFDVIASLETPKLEKINDAANKDLPFRA